MPIIPATCDTCGRPTTEILGGEIKCDLCQAKEDLHYQQRCYSGKLEDVRRNMNELRCIREKINDIKQRIKDASI